jgi:hypothetical protein
VGCEIAARDLLHELISTISKARQRRLSYRQNGGVRDDRLWQLKPPGSTWKSNFEEGKYRANHRQPRTVRREDRELKTGAVDRTVDEGSTERFKRSLKPTKPKTNAG